MKLPHRNFLHLAAGAAALSAGSRADFRKDSGRGIKHVCVQFIELCRLMRLLTQWMAGASISEVDPPSLY
jgi:hypothetical protein